MEAVWRVACYLFFLCTVVSSVRLPHRGNHHQRRTHVRDVPVDRTALSSRSAVVPAPNIPHSLGHPQKPVHQPWYRHITPEDKEMRPFQRLPHNTNRFRPKKIFHELAIKKLGAKPEIHAIPVEPKANVRHSSRHHHHESHITEMDVDQNVEEAGVSAEVALTKYRTKLLHKMRAKGGYLRRKHGRRGRFSRRRNGKLLSSFRKRGCRMRKACPLDVRPVCGSDRVMYDNRCMLMVAACMKGDRHAIVPRRSALCKEDRPL